jgi:hypothetical protein
VSTSFRTPSAAEEAHFHYPRIELRQPLHRCIQPDKLGGLFGREYQSLI